MRQQPSRAGLAMRGLLLKEAIYSDEMALSKCHCMMPNYRTWHSPLWGFAYARLIHRPMPLGIAQHISGDYRRAVGCRKPHNYLWGAMI